MVVYGPRVVVGESDGDRRLGDPKMSGVHRPFEPETSRSRVALHAAIRQPWREQCRSSMVRPPLSLCPRAPILTFAALQVSLHTTSGEGIPPFPPSIHRSLTSLSCALPPLKLPVCRHSSSRTCIPSTPSIITPSYAVSTSHDTRTPLNPESQ